MRGLRFIDENGAPTVLYNKLQGDTNWRNLVGDQMRELYRDLYSTNTNIHNAPDDETKGAFSRVTGKDAASVNRYFATFKALAGLAKFDGKVKEETAKAASAMDAAPATPEQMPTSLTPATASGTAFHYNIQIHLPATTDISVYNSIFKSLKEHLLM